MPEQISAVLKKVPLHRLRAAVIQLNARKHPAKLAVIEAELRDRERYELRRAA